MTRRGTTCAVVSGLVLLTRLPLLSDTSFGGDPDAWRVALAAKHIATTGEYVASRFPSYPVHEIGSALVWPAGALGLNGLTAVFSALAAGLLYLILRHLRVAHAALGALAFAMTPLVYENSIVTMDYVWSVALLLAAFYAVLRGWGIAGGIALGLAVGARLTAVVMLAVFAWIILRGDDESDRWKELLKLGSATALCSVACYLLPFLTYGIDFVQFYDGGIPTALALHRATIDVWGVVGLIGIVSALLLTALGARRDYRLKHVEHAVVIGIMLYVLVYIRLPLEAGYLVPVVPLVVIWLGLRATPSVFATAAVCLVVSPFVLDLESERYVPERLRSPALTFAVGDANLLLLPRGPLVTGTKQTQGETQRIATQLAAVAKLSTPALILVDAPWTRVVISLGLDPSSVLVTDNVSDLDDRFQTDPLSKLWPPLDSVRAWPVYRLPPEPLE